VEVLYEHQITALKKEGAWIREMEVENPKEQGATPRKIIRASMFIDCSYEGDLMARAGVSYTVGRESNSEYKETFNGVQLLDKHQFPDGVVSYKIPGHPESGLVWGISADPLFASGSADKKIQAYNFRICLTRNPEK